MKNIILILIFFSSNSLLKSQTSWFWQNPLPHGSTLSSVNIVSSKIIFTAGPGGIIMKSTNGGYNWNRIKIPGLYNFNATCVRDSLNWDAVGQYITGCFALHYSTTNAGETWTRSDYCAHFDINDIQFLSLTTGYFLSESVYKTTNKGLSWSRAGTVDVWHKIHFPNPDTGYVVGYPGKIQKITNNGNNWFYLPTVTNTRLSSVFFVNGSTGFIGSKESSLIYKTIDGGYNWVPYMLNAQFGITSIHFENELLGFCGNTGGEIFTTTDCGSNWIKKFDNLPLTINSISSLDSNVIAVGIFGEMIKSTDGGKKWLSITSGFFNSTLNSIFFVNKNLGFTGGETGLLLKTTNAGNNWVQLFPGISQTISSVYFLNQYTGYLACDLGLILKTTNSGGNWECNVLQASLKMESVKFLNNDSGYAIGGRYNPFPFPGNEYGYIYKTTTGNNGWYAFHGFSQRRPYGLHITSSKIIYVSGSKGTLVKSNGSNLVTLNSETTANLFDVNFFDEDTGFAVGSNLIIKTTNSGINWFNCFTTTYDLKLSKISIVDHTIYICGNQGTVLKTTNFGNNWIIINTEERYNFLNGIYFTDASTGYVVGRGCNILKTTNGGTTVSINHFENEFPKRFSLLQNYPNPFNPVTNIQYELPFDDIVTIKVFDIVGKEIEEIINQKQNAGKYIAEFDGSDLPSGIYLYSMWINGKLFDAKRMILLK